MASAPYRPVGGAAVLFGCRDKEVLLSGPAGTGKSRGALEKLYLCALKYPGMRAVVLRKTRESLTQAALFTFEEKVVEAGARWLPGPQRNMRQSYRLPNGSEIVIGGLDKPQKVMSTEYDMAYVQEAIEVSETDWEMVTTRLRNGVMPYQQLIADTNPDAPTHWLKRRCERGACRLIESRHEDNPTIWDAAAARPTASGAAYLATLDALTGVRYQRLRQGLWVAAEGLVYEGWDPALHRVDRFPIPREWPRYWACDFGYTHALVIAAFAVDPDGRLFCYRQFYQTGTLVEDAAKEMLALTRDEPKPRAIICDHDAEDRATLERHLGMRTTAAFKAVSPGIQAVATRLRPAGDGKPRLFFLRDSLVRRDKTLDGRKKPTCVEDEFGSYVWDLSANRKRGEEPVKQDDDGVDCVRYLCAHVDSIGKRPQQVAAW